MRLLLRLLVPLLLVVALVPWLPHLLTATDPLPSRADAIFVFAGDVPARPRCAAELYARGLAPRVVFGGGRTLPELIAVERPMTDAAVNATIAMQAGLPIEAAVVLPEGTSTWEDAAVIRRWAEQNEARGVVAVTSPIHSRRARTTLRLAAGAAGFDVVVHACGEPLPPGSLWWLEERPLVQVANETLKLMLYIGRYFIPAWLGLRPAPGDEPRPTPP
ncbi:MAG: YdcF family protein [Thermodesulfobacteriota bacterium]